VEIVSSLRRNYENWVHREAATGTLPCLLEFDGPYLSAFAWPAYLQPIDKFVPPAMLHDFLPSIVAQGTYQGRLYSLGQYDSGMGLWGNRRYLLAAGVRIPTLDAPWGLAEFEQALARLTALKEVDYAINFALYAKGGEFYSYGYAPILQGFGGDVIDRLTYRSAKGVLDGPRSVAAMKRFQHWIEKGWTRAVLDRHDDFDRGKAALSWTGHWAYQGYYKSLGEDLVLLPMPDFGRGIKTGVGSWAWGMSSTCREPAGAWAFLAHLLSTREIVNMTNVNDGVPARRSALAQSPMYGPQGPLRFYVRQLAAAGAPRPTTPAYGTISKAFAEAVGNIVAGGDVQSELGKAAAIIDQTIAAHRGYPYP
jgi:multiple sugar transport system substrate-binding protein